MDSTEHSLWLTSVAACSDAELKQLKQDLLEVLNYIQTEEAQRQGQSSSKTPTYSGPIFLNRHWSFR